MRDRFHDIDDLFYKGISDASEYPSDSAWDKIEGELDRRAAKSYKSKYRKARRSAVVLLLLCIGIGSYHTLGLYNNKEKASAGKSIGSSKTGDGATADDKQFSLPGIQLNTIDATKVNTIDATAVKNEKVGSYTLIDQVTANEFEMAVPQEDYSDYAVMPKGNGGDYSEAIAITSARGTERPALMSIDHALQRDLSIGSPSISGYALKPLSYMLRSSSHNTNSKSRFDLSAYFLPSTSWSDMEDIKPATLPGSGASS